MKFWVYTSRKGELHLFPGDSSGFERARAMQDSDNRATLEELIDHHNLDWGGSEESGSFYIDDGGGIDLMEVE